MTRLTILVALMCPACLLLRNSDRAQETTRGFQIAGVVASDGDLEGGAITARGGTAGMEAQIEAGGSRRGRDIDARLFKGADVGVGFRLSPLGLIGNNARLTRYFDFGAQLGAGGGPIEQPGGSTTYVSGWGGGWLEIGIPGTTRSGYHARLVLEVRREFVTAPYLNDTRFLVGVSWAKRRPVEDDDWMPFFK